MFFTIPRPPQKGTTHLHLHESIGDESVKWAWPRILTHPVAEASPWALAFHR